MADLKEWSYSFEWRIEDFRFADQEIRLEIQSPEFTVRALDNSKWILQIDFGELTSCCLYESGENIHYAKGSVSYKIQILTESGETFDACEGEKPSIFRSCRLFKRRELFPEKENCSADTITVLCSLKRTLSTKQLTQIGEGLTRILTDRSCFEWRVNINESSLKVVGKRYFYLKDIFYKVDLTFDQDDLIVKVHKMLKDSPSFNHITGKITLLNVKGHKEFSIISPHYFDYQCKMSEFPPILSKEQLQNKFNEIVRDGEIAFLCEFYSFIENKTTASISYPECLSCDESISDLCNDFQNLLSSKNHSDVKLRVENKVFEVHRSVLVARSSIFSAMFKHDMPESSMGIIDIKDVDANVLQSFLQFIYTGVMDAMDYENTSKLLLISHKYQVPSLEKVCSLFLRTQLCDENVCNILELADAVQHKTLKDICIDYIATNAEVVFQSLGWEEMAKKNSNLSTEVTLYIGQRVIKGLSHKSKHRSKHQVPKLVKMPEFPCSEFPNPDTVGKMP